MDDLLVDLLESLERLLTQAQAYERALPGDNPTARAAVSTLSELARQARNQAQDLGEALAGPSEEHPLSPRQLEVLQLAAKGLTNKEIAYRLNLSERTVQYHLRSVFNKTGTNSRTEAAAHAIRQGWL